MRLPVCFLAMVITITCLYLPVAASESVTDRAIREYNAENYEEALELLVKQKAESPSSTVSFYLGVSLKHTGDSKAAANNLRDAIKLGPAQPEAYAELIEVLFNMNEFKEAGQWITKAEKEGASPPRIAFLKGLVLSKNNRNKEAIEAFQKAKQLDLSLTQPADFQIAMLYAKEMRTTEAREVLKAVIAVDPSSEIASFAREYETAIKGVAGHRVWRLSAGVAYQYDDNVVLKPSAAIPGVIMTGEKDSGIVGVFRIDYAPLLSGRWFFNGQFNFYSDTYFHTHSHDIIAPTVTANPGYNFQAGAVSLPLSYSYALLDGREYESVFSVKPTFSKIFSPGHIGQFSAGYARRALFQPVLDEHENRDGDVYIASAGYIHPFSKDKGVFNIRYEFSRDLTTGENWDNTGNRISAGLLVPLSSKVNLAASGEAFLQDYTKVHTIFGVKRRDRTYTGSANIIWEVSKMFNLNLQYAHTTAASNISLYEYDRNIYTAGIECRF